MIYKCSSYKEFIDIVKNQEYKEKDKLEAKQFGCDSIIECYKINPYKKYSQYYVIYDDNKNVLATICLQRDGFLIFFVTKHLDRTNAIQFVKDIKYLANKYASLFGSIFVKTIKWYEEAHKLDKIVGFKPYKITGKYTIYVMDDNG